MLRTRTFLSTKDTKSTKKIKNNTLIFGSGLNLLFTLNIKLLMQRSIALAIRKKLKLFDSRFNPLPDFFRVFRAFRGLSLFYDEYIYTKFICD